MSLRRYVKAADAMEAAATAKAELDKAKLAEADVSFKLEQEKKNNAKLATASNDKVGDGGAGASSTLAV